MDEIKIHVPAEEAMEFFGQIIDLFDDILESKGVTIPSSEQEKRESDPEGYADNPAVFYGEDYSTAQDGLAAICEAWKKED